MSDKQILEPFKEVEEEHGCSRCDAGLKRQQEERNAEAHFFSNPMNAPLVESILVFATSGEPWRTARNVRLVCKSWRDLSWKGLFEADELPQVNLYPKEGPMPLSKRGCRLDRFPSTESVKVGTLSAPLIPFALKVFYHGTRPFAEAARVINKFWANIARIEIQFQKYDTKAQTQLPMSSSGRRHKTSSSQVSRAPKHHRKTQAADMWFPTLPHLHTLDITTYEPGSNAQLERFLDHLLDERKVPKLKRLRYEGTIFLISRLIPSINPPKLVSITIQVEEPLPPWFLSGINVALARRLEVLEIRSMSNQRESPLLVLQEMPKLTRLEVNFPLTVADKVKKNLSTLNSLELNVGNCVGMSLQMISGPGIRHEKCEELILNFNPHNQDSLSQVLEYEGLFLRSMTKYGFTSFSNLTSLSFLGFTWLLAKNILPLVYSQLGFTLKKLRIHVKMLPQHDYIKMEPLQFPDVWRLLAGVQDFYDIPATPISNLSALETLEFGISKEYKMRPDWFLLFMASFRRQMPCLKKLKFVGVTMDLNHKGADCEDSDSDPCGTEDESGERFGGENGESGSENVGGEDVEVEVVEEAEDSKQVVDDEADQKADET